MNVNLIGWEAEDVSQIPSELVYNIPELKLSGQLRGVIIDCLAGSGGYSGTTKEKKEQFFVSNNPYKTNVKVQGVPGVYGPLPMGYYYMSPHEKKPHMVRLEPFSANRMFGRSGFLIHGCGPIGSEGCIVPFEFNNVVKICKAVADYITALGKKPVLNVVAVSANLDFKETIG